MVSSVPRPCSDLAGKCPSTHWCSVLSDSPLADGGSSISTYVPFFLFLFAVCSQPLDVVLLLDGSSALPDAHFDKMKSFAKAFISEANLGERCT